MVGLDLREPPPHSRPSFRMAGANAIACRCGTVSPVAIRGVLSTAAVVLEDARSCHSWLAHHNPRRCVSASSGVSAVALFFFSRPVPSSALHCTPLGEGGHRVAERDGAGVLQDDAGDGGVSPGRGRVGRAQGQHEELRPMT